MAKYRKRNNEGAAVVEAQQLTPATVDAIAEWCHGKYVEEIDPFDRNKCYVGLNLVTWEGLKRASEGDWVIQDAMGDFHIRWAEQFAVTFEEVPE